MRKLLLNEHLIWVLRQVEGLLVVAFAAVLLLMHVFDGLTEIVGLDLGRAWLTLISLAAVNGIIRLAQHPRA